MSENISCLYTTVRNTAGTSRVFGFLPPYGRRLDADEEFTSFGDLYDNLKNTRSRQALASAVLDGELQIVSTPAVIVEDSVTGDTKMLTLASGTVVVADPCWVGDSSSEGGESESGSESEGGESDSESGG